MTNSSPELSDAIKQASILVVDDEPANVLLLQKTLSRYGFSDVRCTQDPRTVLPMVQERCPALVLLDINMPHLDGYQVLAQLVALGQQAPSVLMLTAQASVEHKVKALAGGARDYLSKPFEFPELVARVRNLLESHLYGLSMQDQNLKLESMVQARTAELHSSRLDVIRRLGRAAEFRDNETGLHIVRMSHFSRLLATAAGLPQDEAELIYQASPMHDIGKIGIPDAILLKPGKLDVAEFETMKTHASIGAEVLSGSDTPLLQMAHTIALGHHEKWDGSGYPAGAACTAIPEAARIVAVADVFDALTSVRPYKPAWPLERAVALLKDSRNTHFEGRLVDLFLEQMDAVQAIQSRYAEPTEPALHTEAAP